MTNYNEMKGNAMSNKTYRLLKDLPFAKAGEIFKSKILDDGEEYLFWGEIKTEKIENFDEWFEEINPTWIEHWHITHVGDIIRESNHILREDTSIEDARKEIGNSFDTEEEAEKHLEWLKARTVLIRDTKGLKPDWTNESEWGYGVCYDYYLGEIVCVRYTAVKIGEIFFKTKEDAKNSIKNHEKEWKIYLGVE